MHVINNDVYSIQMLSWLPLPMLNRHHGVNDVIVVVTADAKWTSRSVKTPSGPPADDALGYHLDSIVSTHFLK